MRQMLWGSRAKVSTEPINVRHEGRDYLVAIRVSSRASQIRLRVTDGGAEVVLPRWAKRRDAESAVSRNKAWLAKHLDRKTVVQEESDNKVWVEGQCLNFVHDLGTKQSVLIEGENIHVGGTQPHETFETWLKKVAAERFQDSLAIWTVEMGLHPTRVSLRDQKTKWGACTSRGTVTFNWRLVMAPPEVLEYVVIHELAHLKELNHSPRFWAIVEMHCPTWRKHKAWLKKHGHALKLPV